MKYCGIDLHSNKSVVSVIDAAGKSSKLFVRGGFADVNANGFILLPRRRTTAASRPPHGLARRTMKPELLNLLPPEVAQSLGPWIDRLALALGPLRARVRVGQGAPDGYDGLASRGPFERLSVSDWALAEVVPEEFVRRAASW